MAQSPSSKILNVAVTGALTPMGREVINLLSERDFPLDEIFAVETGPVSGMQVSFGEDEVLEIEKFDAFDFEKIQMIIHAGKPEDATKLMKVAIGYKATMIDLSGAFADDEQVPVVVAGLNEDILENRLMKNTVAVPSSAATIIALALKPLSEIADITHVIATVFDPAVTGGRGAMDEVFNQTKAMFMNNTIRSEHYTKPIAFNAIPMVGAEREDGYSEVEFKTIAGLNKIYKGTTMAISHVSVPIFTGMGISVTIMGKNEITAIKAALQMTGQDGIGIIDDNQDIPTPAEIGGEDLVYIARLRGNTKNGLQFWVCADSIRRGQALNAVQVAEVIAG